MNSHPYLDEIRKLGCVDEVKIRLAFDAYINLCEVFKMWNVTCRYSATLGVIFITACKTKSSDETVFIPVPWYFEMPHGWLESCQQLLCDQEPKSLTLIIQDSSSNFTMCSLTNGLIPPLSPEETKERKEKLEVAMERNANKMKMVVSTYSKDGRS